MALSAISRYVQSLCIPFSFIITLYFSMFWEFVLLLPSDAKTPPSESITGTYKLTAFIFIFLSFYWESISIDEIFTHTDSLIFSGKESIFYKVICPVCFCNSIKTFIAKFLTSSLEWEKYGNITSSILFIDKRDVTTSSA